MEPKFIFSKTYAYKRAPHFGISSIWIFPFLNLPFNLFIDYAYPKYIVIDGYNFIKKVQVNNKHTTYLKMFPNWIVEYYFFIIYF